jgi:hypothetical protein
MLDLEICFNLETPWTKNMLFNILPARSHFHAQSYLGRLKNSIISFWIRDARLAFDYIWSSHGSKHLGLHIELRSSLEECTTGRSGRKPTASTFECQVHWHRRHYQFPCHLMQQILGVARVYLFGDPHVLQPTWNHGEREQDQFLDNHEWNAFCKKIL